jgi:beta-galactosidase
MHLGVQYYRAPFPEERYWEDDFERIKDSGLDCVQLWVLWGWVESKPGEFRFDDYDKLVELAAAKGLGVVLSTIAEIQPYWIHREVPGSEMIDHMGRKVISSNRGECHFGLTPGGCTDNPGVWERMSGFLRAVVERYRGAEHLVGWDAWNELRWNVQADGAVCRCDHSLKAFHGWLSEKYGGLEGLNTAWKRRYGEWSEVLPGKLPGRPYTEMMAFQHFNSWKCDQHARARYELMKKLDPDRPVTVHASQPSPLMGGGSSGAVDRGNDWFMADHTDGAGCSSFPVWGGMDDAEFGSRVEYVYSAARGKAVWLSELQGGRSSIGFQVFPPVEAARQQRWVWNGLACGADTILFWCWRDEVFGRESAGFGISGADGFAEERLAAMRLTRKVLSDNRELIENYRPSRPEVGVLFSPRSYYLHWAQEGSARLAKEAVMGYARGLVRRSIPYLVVEEEHLDELEGLKVLFMPRVQVTHPELEERLEAFVRGGGTLVCESECGAFSPEGLYRYPQERFTSRLAGVCEVGRRELNSDSVGAELDGEVLSLPARQWLTPWQRGAGDVWGLCADGALLLEAPVSDGWLVLMGSYFGDAYYQHRAADFERFLELICRRAGWKPRVEVLGPRPSAESFVYVKSGRSGEDRLVFVFTPPGCDAVRMRFDGELYGGERVLELFSGQELAFGGDGDGRQLQVPAGKWGLSLLVGR